MKERQKIDFNGCRACCFEKTLVTVHSSCTYRAADDYVGCRQSTYGTSISALQSAEFNLSYQLWTDRLRCTCPSMTERRCGLVWKKMTPLNTWVGFSKRPKNPPSLLKSKYYYRGNEKNGFSIYLL